MTVRIAERVFSVWRALFDDAEAAPALVLLLSLVGDQSAASCAVRDSVTELESAHDNAAGGELPWPGEWDWLRVADGLVVTLQDSDDFEAALVALAAALGRRGIEGTFDVYEQPPIVRPPPVGDLLECRVRLRGNRVHGAPRAYHWHADQGAEEAFLAVAARWCRTCAQDASGSLLSRSIRVPVKPGEDVVDRMREAISANWHTVVSAVAADEFRSVAARSYTGGMSLIIGGARLDRDGWQPPLTELIALLRDHSDLLAYAYIRRGRNYGAAEQERSLPSEWPRRPGDQPRGHGFAPEAFEDVYAPDAFAIQLLGPGYAGRVPDSPMYRQQPAGDTAVLLVHVDLPVWFDAPFLAPGAPKPPAPPAVLTRARHELAPILYSPGVLSRNGYVDELEL